MCNALLISEKEWSNYSKRTKLMSESHSATHLRTPIYSKANQNY